MPKKIIRVVVCDGGKILVDAEGFTGKSCEEATKFLAKEFKATTSGKKRDYYQRETQRCQQH